MSGEDAKPPIVILDTCAFKNIGDSTNNPNCAKILQCAINGHIDLRIPEVVIVERAGQMYEERYRPTTRGVGNEDMNVTINDAYQIELRRIKMRLIKNGAENIISRKQSHDQYAYEQTGLSPPIKNGKKSNDYRDALICKAIFEIVESNEDRDIYALSSDKGARDRLTSYNDSDPKPKKRINVYGDHLVFIKQIIDVFTDCPIPCIEVTDEDLQPVEAPHFHDREGTEREEEQSSGFDMEDSLREMAERLQTSQKCLMATTQLMFPATDKQSVSEKMQRAWGFDPPETEGAAQFLIQNGFLEDLSGTYIVRHDDFAMQAIESIGEDVTEIMTSSVISRS